MVTGTLIRSPSLGGGIVVNVRSEGTPVYKEEQAAGTPRLCTSYQEVNSTQLSRDSLLRQGPVTVGDYLTVTSYSLPSEKDPGVP